MVRVRLAQARRVIALAGVTAGIAVKLAVLGVNLVRFPVLPTTSPAGPEAAIVSLLVPMRDEAANLRVTVPGLLAQAGVELIVLDDGSTDGSALLTDALVAAHPHARVLAGRPAPPGWVGKTWACQQLADAARGDVLVFCDADVVLDEHAVANALCEMRRQRADVLSVFPRQLLGSVGEALVTPLIDDVLLCLLPFALLAAPVPSAATANGSLLLFSRAAYDALGGFASVRHEIVEDVALARATRRAGLTLGLALGGDAVQSRNYVGYRGVVRGLGRGLLPAFGGSRLALTAAVAAHVAAYALPPWLARRNRRWLLPAVLGVVERLLVALKADPASAWLAPLGPVSALALVPVGWQALRRQQTWKGRTYS